MALGKKTIGIIESKFFNYYKIKAAVAEARAEQDAKGGVTGGDSGHSRKSDPTAVAAIKHVMPLNYVYIQDGLFEMKIYDPEKWVKIMEYTIVAYENQLIGTLANRRYFKKEKPDYTFDSMGIGQRTYYDWRDDFITQAIFFAIAEGLISAEKTQE